MRAIVSDYSRPGDLVLDPCAGGGTTLVAAVELGRRAIGCEPDAGRYAIAAKRILAAREQRVLSLDVGPTGGEQIALVER
jgi:site-specific DNA-methyltransferase (adenine-specific)